MADREYIDRGELMKFPIRIDHYDEVHGNRDFVLGIESVLEYAESIPAADVVEGKWISVKDGLPDRGGQYLAVVPSPINNRKHSVWLLWYHTGKGFCDFSPEWGDVEIDDVTHWMPLPQPPEGE